MHKIFRLLAATFLLNSANSAEIRKIQSDGEEIYRLGNNRLEVDVSPSNGGRIIRLFDKISGRELTPKTSFSISPGGVGLLNDRVIPERGGTCRDYETSPYQTVSAKETDSRAVLTLKCDRMPLAVEKQISLKENESKVFVSYSLTNPGNQDFSGRFWSCSVISPDPKAPHEIYLPEGSYNDPQAPSRKNHITHTRDPKLQPNHFIYHPKQDFAAVLTGATGAAVVVPFEFLDYFYSYAPAGAGELPTLEWFTLPFHLKPFAEGKKFAVNHPEMADPLQDYVYRFDMTVEPVSANTFQYETYRPLPKTAKTTRFKVNAGEAPLYTDFAESPSIELKQTAKPLNILAIVNVPSVQELAELNRRVKQNLKAVEVAHPHVFSNGDSSPYYAWRAPDSSMAMEEALKSKPDVILFSGTLQKSLPKKLCDEIVGQVKDGATAVYISARNEFPALIPASGGKEIPGWVAAGIPWKELPVGTPAVREYPCGKGRVIHVPFKMYKQDLLWTQGSHAVTPRIETEVSPSLKYWEYYFSFYGKLFRYLSGSQSGAAIESAAVRADRIELNIDNHSPEKDFLLRITRDGPEKTDSFAKEITLQPGKNTLSIPFPGKNPPDGLYFYNLLLDDRRETADWLTVAVRHKTPNRIESLETEKYAHRAGEAVQGKIRVAGKGTLTLKLRDFQGRVMSRRTWENASGEIVFSMKNEFKSSIPLVHLEAVLTANGAKISEKTKTVTLEPLPLPRLQPVLWTGGEDNWISGKIDKELSQLGFLVGTGYTMAIATESEQKRMAESMMSAGMRFAPMSMHRISVWGNQLKSIRRDPCLRNPEYGEKIKRDVEKTVAMSERYFPARYYSGDENSLGHYGSAHDFCQSPWCLAGFRKAMREKYGSLEHLNRIWKTSFLDWENVMPLTLKEAHESGKPIPWYEHRLYMMNAVSDALARVKQELDQAAPGAKLGFSGQLITDLHGAFNWLEALKYVDCPTAYIRDTDGLPDLMRSNGLSGFSGGAWIGYGAALDDIRCNYWSQIVNGLFSPSYWWSGYFIRRGDRQLSPEGQHIRKTLAEIRESGVDKMFAEGRRTPSGIAIVYSIPSLVITGITGEKTLMNQLAYTNNFSGWAGLVRDMGYPAPTVIPSAELSSITPEKYPILILPLTQVLSDRESESLRKYTENGGFLVADSACGLYDECGLRRPMPPMSDLFGIRIMKGIDANAGTVVVSGSMLNVTPAADQIAVTDGNPKGSIQTVTAPTHFGTLKIAGGRKEIAPAAVIKKTGNGRTLYLNFLLNSYPVIRTKRASSLPIISIMKSLFAESGHPASHDLPPGTSLAEYESEGNRCIGLTRLPGDSDGRYTLRFGQEYEVYDTLRHQYMGRHSVYQGTIAGNDVAVFALLPRKIRSFEANIRFDGRRFLAAIRTDDVNSVVRTATFRNGLEIRDLTGNRNVRGNQEIPLDPGLEPAGKWTFRITNLFTGKVIEKNITIQGTVQ